MKSVLKQDINKESSNLRCVKSVQTRTFLWSVFFRTRTEYGKIRSIPPHSVQMRENTSFHETIIPIPLNDGSW